MISHTELLGDYNFRGGAGKASTDFSSSSGDEAELVSGRWEIIYYKVSSAGDVPGVAYLAALSEADYLENGSGILEAGQASAIDMIASGEGDYSVSFSNVAKVSLESSSLFIADIVIGQVHANDGGTPFNFGDGVKQGEAGSTVVGDIAEGRPVTASNSMSFGDIWINNDFDTDPSNKESTTPNVGTLWNTNILKGTIQYVALMHELGHALGLREMAEAATSMSQPDLDNQKYSIMSYKAVDGMGDANDNAIVAPKGGLSGFPCVTGRLIIRPPWP